LGSAVGQGFGRGCVMLSCKGDQSWSDIASETVLAAPASQDESIQADATPCIGDAAKFGASAAL
jgi:hypothetical protein